MDSGYNWEVKLPKLARGLTVGKKDLDGNSQGFGLNKSVIRVVGVMNSLAKVGSLEQNSSGGVSLLYYWLMLGYLLIIYTNEHESV